MSWPRVVTCLRRRARYPSSQSVSDARPKIAAPTSSFEFRQQHDDQQRHEKDTAEGQRIRQIHR
jgi:hypothetical protein